MGLLLSILLVTSTVLGEFGSIYVRTEPGIVVYVDGVQRGVTDVENSGLLIDTIPVGDHDVRFQMGMATSSQRVRVTNRQMTTVLVSSLALRTMSRKGGVEIKVTPANPNCIAMIGGTEVQLIDSVAGAYDLGAGMYDLAVTCGTKSLKAKATVTSGRTIDVLANFTKKTMAATGDHERVPQAVNVLSSRDRVASSGLPADAKRALMTSLPSGVEVLAIRMRSEAMVDADFEAPSIDSATTLMSRLMSSGEFTSIRVMTPNGRVPREGHVRFMLELTIASW